MANFRILSYNVKLYTLIADECEKRAEQIGDIIVDKDYDVVCLQEVFSEDPRDILAEKLEQNGYNVIAKCGGPVLIPQDSGLFFASKFPIRSHNFEHFRMLSGEIVNYDALAAKGFLRVSLDLSGIMSNLNLIVYNTHFQADYGTKRNSVDIINRETFLESVSELERRNMEQEAALLINSYDYSNFDSDECELVSGLSAQTKQRILEILQYIESYSGVRNKELNRIKESIYSIKFNGESKNTGMILCGDLNIDGRRQSNIEYKEFKSDFINEFTGKDSFENNPDVITSRGDGGCRYDYILTLNKVNEYELNNLTVVNGKVDIEQRQLSDHYGICSEISAENIV